VREHLLQAFVGYELLRGRRDGHYRRTRIVFIKVDAVHGDDGVREPELGERLEAREARLLEEDEHARAEVELVHGFERFRFKIRVGIRHGRSAVVRALWAAHPIHPKPLDLRVGE